MTIHYRCDQTRSLCLWNIRIVLLYTILFQLETALVADAIDHLDKAMRNFMEEWNAPPPMPPSLCFQDSKTIYYETAWQYGPHLKDSLRMVSIVYK